MTDNLDLGNGNNQVTNPVPPTNPEPPVDVNDPKGNNNDINDNPNESPTEPAADEPNPSTGGLEVGSVVEVDGKEYIVADNGDLVDSDGKVFVEAKDVEDWLKGFDDDNDSDSISIDSVMKAIGVDVTGEDGKPVEFANTIDGIKSYVNSVIDIKSTEVQEGAINKLFNDAPILREFVDYLTVNNGDPRGFGEIRDRSGITVDKDNVEQQKAIIKVAAQEFGNSSLSDAYIKYLEDSGNLYNEAVTQLTNLQKADASYKEEMVRRANAARAQQEAERKEYWDRVEAVINSKNIGGYKLPDTFVKEVDGKKMTFTPNDFLAYVSQPKYVDENNNAITGYQKDLSEMSDEDLLNAELLDAYLKFTGGSYKDLVEMAVNEREVKKLRLTAKQHRTAPTVRKPNAGSQSKVNINDISLG